jgi:NADH oxidase (H2O2-forming)
MEVDILKFDVVVIGGGPAGMAVVSTAMAAYPRKKIAMIKKESQTLIPCGIPYTFSTLDSVEEDVMSTKPLEERGLEVIIDEVKEIDVNSKKIFTSSGENLEYDKLVLATGSKPILPKIPGADLYGVFTVPKDIQQITRMKDALKKMNKVAIVGAGFIGMEMCDEIHKMGKQVTLIEAKERVLPIAFDPEFSLEVQKLLEKNHIRTFTSTMVKEITGSGHVDGINFDSGEHIDVDGVILGIGYRPNSNLAKNAGLFIGMTGGIWTDEYMRTSAKDVFAVGDCTEHKEFFSRRPSKLMLASTAAFDARVAGTNLFNIRLIREIKGNIGIFSTSIFGETLGAAGGTEVDAVESGFEIITGNAATVDRHPGLIPDASKVRVKLVFSKESGILLGGQIMGGKSVGEMINVLGVAVQSRMSVTELVALQIGTQPLLTASPVVYPIVTAALDAYSKMHVCQEG